MVMWGRCGAGAFVIMRIHRHPTHRKEGRSRSDRHDPDPPDLPEPPSTALLIRRCEAGIVAPGASARGTTGCDDAQRPR